MSLIEIVCDNCQKPFSREQKHVNEAKKKGWHQFCSSQCLSNYRKTGKRFTCQNPDCNKTFYRSASWTKASNRHFCSRSCAAKVINKERTIRNRNISKIKTNFKSCANPNCDKLIPQRNKYCSNRCQGEVTKKSIDEHRADVIAAIRGFFAEYTRIPVKKEMWGLYRKARKAFGTWNKAIKAAGYEPNPVLFAKKYIANDGHRCDSLAEKIIDDWLSARNIPHEINVPYEGTLMTADFKVDGVLIEFLGLTGEVGKYDQLLEKKKKLWEERHLEVIAIYPGDLFPESQLNRVLRQLTTT